MNQPEVIARHYATGKPVRIRRRGGGAPSLGTAAGAQENLWLAPALTDLQVNGYAGVDFQQDNLTASRLLEAGAALRQAGCARWLLTLVTDEWGKLVSRLRHLASLRAQSAELRRCIAGWHVEGPFLSGEPGYCGAHPAQFMRDPTPAALRELRVATGEDPLLLTLAPERPGAIEAIRLARELGFKVSLGHTNASGDVLRAAVEAGASGFTHLGNGCPVTLDRHDNILWRVFDTPGLTIGLIPDTFHVSPPLFRLAHRILGTGAIYYVSDAIAAAGAPPGRYSVGSLTVEVGPDQIVHHPGSRQFAGSALRPIDGVLRAAVMLGRPWQQVWDYFSVNPARYMGLASADDWCLLEFDPADGAWLTVTVLDCQVQTP